MITSSESERPGEYAWGGRLVGLLVLAGALVFVALGGLKRRPAEEGGGWGWGFVALAAASGGDDPISAAIGVVALMALAPFAIAVAPVALVLAVVAWWMAQGAVQFALGAVLACLASAIALWATARREAVTP